MVEEERCVLCSGGKVEDFRHFVIDCPNKLHIMVHLFISYTSKLYLYNINNYVLHIICHVHRNVTKGQAYSLTACPAETYRSLSDPASSCLPCPANTIASGVAVAVCPCIAGFFRAAQENPSVGCTRKSHHPCCYYINIVSLQKQAHTPLIISCCKGSSHQKYIYTHLYLYYSTCKAIKKQYSIVVI